MSLIDDGCMRVDAAATANVYALWNDARNGNDACVEEGGSAPLYDIERKPECIRRRTGASSSGGRYGVTPRGLRADGKGAGMHPRELTSKGSIEAKEGESLPERVPLWNTLRQLSGGCGNWYEQRPADALVSAQNAIRERDALARAFFCPHPWVSESFYDTCRQMGMRFRRPPCSSG